MDSDIDFFDLSIFDSGDPGRAVALARFGDDVAIEVLPCTLVNALCDFRDRLERAARGAGLRPKSAELTTFGQQLFTFVVQNSLNRLYQRLPSQPHRVRIRVLSNRADLQALPWEYLQEPNSNPVPNILRSVVRIVPTIGVPTPISVQLGKTIRMLFVYADPVDQGSVEWLDIKATIEREFRSRLPGNLEIDVVESANKQSLTAAIQAKPYHLFHFSGHGEVRADGKAQLLLVNYKSKKSQPILAEELAVLLQGRNLQIAVLGACSTGAGNFAMPYAVVAQSLVASGVPAVVANQFAITNSTVATFTSALYTELLKSGNIDDAVAEARLPLAMLSGVGDDASFEWGIPALYRHMGGAQVFAI